MNETLVNTKTSLEPLILTSLSKLLPRLLTINKIDESEFQPCAALILVIFQLGAFIENSLCMEHCGDLQPPNPVKGNPLEGVLIGFLRQSSHFCKSVTSMFMNACLFTIGLLSVSNLLTHC